MFRAVLCAGLILATPALAHEGVSDPSVKARMDAMMAIGRATEVLGTMAKGERAFDATAASTAAAEIASHASQVPALFQDQATDPKSEALPAIWTNFNDFTAQSDALKLAAEGADTSSLSGLRGSMRAIGQSCGACHRDYRLTKD